MNDGTSRFAISISFLLGLGGLAGCAADTSNPSANETTAHADEGWDSQDGNPTHATHSYLTEYAIDQLKAQFPELQTYRANIVDGANRELHELPVSDPAQEALRQEIVGTNWACDHPERLWTHAKASYAAGDKAKAYWYVGIILHFVEDMGVPAHAFHVIHQGSLSQKDNFELLGLASWSPSYSAITVSDPYFGAPSDYVVWNGNNAKSHFNSVFPGVTYTRTYFASSWLWISSKQATFLHNREGNTAVAAKFALLAAAELL